MKYNYNLTDDFVKDEARKALKELGAKDKETTLPKVIVNSHKEIVSLLREASKDNSCINPRALDAIEKYDRTQFFNWNDIPEEMKQKVITPYCFMATYFAEDQTIPSPHIVLGQASFLNLKDGQKILEIGAGSGYNAVIIAETVGENSKVYSTEIRQNLINLSKKNIKKLGLEDKVVILEAKKSVLGSPENSPFDRIYTTLAATKTSQVEELIDQLAINGMLMLPIAKIGNTKKQDEAKFWEPGMDVVTNDIYFSDISRGFIRSATYTFKKINEKNIIYSITVSNLLGPLFE